MNYHGLEIVPCGILPIDRTYPASDIYTREEVKICSGEKIHIVQLGDKLLCSEDVINSIKELPQPQPPELVLWQL